MRITDLNLLFRLLMYLYVFFLSEKFLFYFRNQMQLKKYRDSWW